MSEVRTPNPLSGNQHKDEANKQRNQVPQKVWPDGLSI